MKFLLRCLLVLAIAVALGAMLYYAVQALPGASPSLRPPGTQLEPQNGNNTPQNPGPRPEERGNDRGGGIRLRSVIGILGKAILFSVIVLVSVIAKNIVFQKKPNNNKSN